MMFPNVKPLRLKNSDIARDWSLTYVLTRMGAVVYHDDEISMKSSSPPQTSASSWISLLSLLYGCNARTTPTVSDETSSRKRLRSLHTSLLAFQKYDALPEGQAMIYRPPADAASRLGQGVCKNASLIC